MPINTVIQQKRKEAGLTQEQVADYLNVSIPAVSKWENGSTSPDISLLPPLARLLKIDLNTLFCFQEDMTRQEIEYFCKEITETVRTEGIGEGFEQARQKIHEYPHCEPLLHCLTFQLDGLLITSGLPPEEKEQYDKTLSEWYRRLSESGDDKISNSADYMMVSRLIREGDYDEAQEILDRMPDRENLLNGMADKLMLQVNIYQQQGKTEEAVKDLQNALLMSLNKVQLLLWKLMDAELASGKMPTAKYIADKTVEMTALFDLWAYNGFPAPLQIASAEENADECIRILRQMLKAMLTPWDPAGSPLFYRVAKTTGQNQMLPAILSELERDPAYDFLRKSDQFEPLISAYREAIET